MSDQSFEKSEVDESVLLAILRDAQDALDAADVPFVLIGGIPSAVYGRPRATQDLDILVRSEDKDRALEGLEVAGFETRKTDPKWLYKASKKDVLVDVIFRAEGNFYLDDEMIDHGVDATFKGEAARLVAPEDLLIMKAVATEEEIAHYWFDGLAVLVEADLDWDYLVTRAAHGAKRVLSLLLFAQSQDLLVPDEPIAKLWKQVF
ncbi:MAG: nucleotidyltransferase [Actinomycetota bacterium]